MMRCWRNKATAPLGTPGTHARKLLFFFSLFPLFSSFRFLAVKVEINSITHDDWNMISVRSGRDCSKDKSKSLSYKGLAVLPAEVEGKIPSIYGGCGNTSSGSRPLTYHVTVRKARYCFG